MKTIFTIILIFNLSHTFAKVSEKKFRTIGDTIQSIYHERINYEVDSLEFYLNKDSDKKPNAFAKRKKNKWKITVISSLLDLDKATPATLTMILCHEVGHFLGGEPHVVGRPITSVISGRAPKKMSCEGQADYFASADCFKKVVKKLPWILDEQNIYPTLNEVVYNCKDDQLCEKSIYAGYETVLTYQELLTKYGVHEGFQGHMNTLDSDRTLNYVGEYPSLECRFKTFVNGILCSSLNTNECADMKWSRPNCWF